METRRAFKLKTQLDKVMIIIYFARLRLMISVSNLHGGLRCNALANASSVFGGQYERID